MRYEYGELFDSTGSYVKRVRFREAPPQLALPDIGETYRRPPLDPIFLRHQLDIKNAQRRFSRSFLPGVVGWTICAQTFYPTFIARVPSESDFFIYSATLMASSLGMLDFISRSTKILGKCSIQSWAKGRS